MLIDVDGGIGCGKIGFEGGRKGKGFKEVKDNKGFKEVKLKWIEGSRDHGLAFYDITTIMEWDFL